MITPKLPSHLALLAVSVGALALIAACGSVSKASAPTATTPPASAPSATAAPAATPSPTSTLTGPVGTVYQVTDDSGNKMTVTLARVIDPAQGADQYTTPDNGKRFVGAVFTLKGVSGTF